MFGSEGTYWLIRETHLNSLFSPQRLFLLFKQIGVELTELLSCDLLYRGIFNTVNAVNKQMSKIRG